MGKKRKKNIKRDSERYSFIRTETFQSILAVLMFVAAIFISLAFFGKAGVVGATVAKILKPLLGWGYFILPLIFIIIGASFLLSVQKRIALPQILGGVLFFLSGMGALEIIFEDKGGKIGGLVAAPTLKLFDVLVATILLFSLIIISLIIIFESKLRFLYFLNLFVNLKKFFSKDKGESDHEIDNVKINGNVETQNAENDQDENENSKQIKESPKKDGDKKSAASKKTDDDISINLNKVSISGMVYKAPTLDLLSRDTGKPGVGDIKANANIIKRTLQNFGIHVEMDEITIGPTVTRYALKPAEGVKLSRIVGLQNDLALALAAHPIRIEAPIPGKSLVGIEIPNSIKTTVGLGSILSEKDFQNSPKPLFIALGKAISGKAHFDDVARMPHLLIAGATGSGKSVMVHSLITSLLYRNSPENLKLILIDPKRVELTLYNKIPHLLTPVLTDPKKAILALKWAAKEMDRRYDILEAEKVRDIGSYHKNVLEPALKKQKGGAGDTDLPEAMPYIVVVIDELADIMTNYPREMEAAVVRLAQMSRAVGIHLVLSTQRPSVNVITGLIKANIPTRIALQVASQIDSRTILDMAGAEKLLGAGDMLFLSSEMSKPHRIQTAYISETEVKEVVKFISENNPSDGMSLDINLETAQSAVEIGTDGGDGEEDDLYEEARELVLKAGKASTSYLQRRLRIGYARAARLIDMLEERGVVGAGEGSKPREVLSANNGGQVPEEDDLQYN